jgi:hypothetical protein
MDTTIPYLRSQSDLLTEIKVLVRHSSGTRWSDAEYYTALNSVLYTWADNVKMPFLYTITNGWVASDYDYALPSYIRPPIFPQLLRRIPYYEYEVESTTSSWQDVIGWELEPDGDGGQVLRLFAAPRSDEARVGFFAPNSRVPTTIPTTSGSTASSATSVTLESAVEVDDVGFIKIGAEWMSYAGVDRGASTTTLNNLNRALNGTTAATHNTSSNVLWGVGMDTLSLQKLLFDQWRSFLHAYFIQDGGTHEIGRHEKGLGYYEQLATNFWPTYRPQRKRPRLTLSRKALLLR